MNTYSLKDRLNATKYTHKSERFPNTNAPTNTPAKKITLAIDFL